MNLAADQIIERLNSMVSADPKAVMDLISNRVPCNDALAEHPTCQVDNDDGTNRVGLLGILNGILGKDVNGWGYLSAVIDDDWNLIRFIKTPSYKD